MKLISLLCISQNDMSHSFAVQKAVAFKLFKNKNKKLNNDRCHLCLSSLWLFGASIVKTIASEL